MADGSSYFESESVKVMCAVYGPRATNKPEFSQRAALQCDVKCAPFARAGGRKVASQTEEESYLSTLCAKTLEACVLLDKYPKSQIDVYVYVLDWDGPALGCALTAASLALADARIEMRDLIASCTVGISSSLVLDPDDRDASKIVEDGGALLTLGYMPQTNEVVQFHLMGGSLGAQQLQQVTELALDACQKMSPVIRETLLQSEKLKKAN